MLNMEEMQKKRWSALFQVMNFAPFGGLFRIDEEVWKERAGPGYDRSNTRASHPGCSITRLHNTLGPVRMLHGTSRKDYRKDVIAIKNIYGKEHTTWFGGLDPIPMEIALWQQNKIWLAEKARADDSELHALEALCARRGW